jgi:hypothetical protein
MFFSFPPANLPLWVQRDRNEVKVLAAKDIAIGGIRIPAMVMAQSNVSAESASAGKVSVTAKIESLGLERTFFFLPEVSLPPKLVDEDDVHKWKPSNTMCAFWIIRKSANRTEENCEVTHVQITSMICTDTAAQKPAAGNSKGKDKKGKDKEKDKDDKDNEAKVLTCVIDYPFITNKKALRKDDELLLFREKVVVKKGPAKRDWIADHKSSQRKEGANAKKQKVQK